jgi:hypothetical protein
VFGFVRLIIRNIYESIVSSVNSSETIPLSITLSSIEDEDGNLIGVSEIAKDISKIKEAEVELQNQIKFLKDLSFFCGFFGEVVSKMLP